MDCKCWEKKMLIEFKDSLYSSPMKTPRDTAISMSSSPLGGTPPFFVSSLRLSHDLGGVIEGCLRFPP